jgi:hypothetical protein
MLGRAWLSTRSVKAGRVFKPLLDDLGVDARLGREHGVCVPERDKAVKEIPLAEAVTLRSDGMPIERLDARSTL